MDGVPVKISERCRPPNRVHLPGSLRTLPPSDIDNLTYSFDHEENAVQWVQERRGNLVEERTERRRRLEAKDSERQRRRELAEAEAARQQEVRRQQQEEQAAQQRQQQQQEAARRQQEEEDRLRQEEQERLEHFRLQRVASQQATTGEAAVASEAVSPAVAAADNPTARVDSPVPAPTPPPGGEQSSPPAAAASSSQAAAQSAAANGPNQPAAANTPNQPAMANTPNQPATANTPNQPATANTPNQPATANSPNQPATANSPNQPATANSPNQPATVNTTNRPATANTQNQSATANTPNQPATANSPNQSATANSQNQSTTASTPEQTVAANTPRQTAEAAAPTPPPVTRAATSSAQQQSAQFSSPEQQQQQQWRQPAPISNNPYNPFVGGGALLTPQACGQQVTGGVCPNPRTGSFNYRDFESQATDPFDSVALKSINDMEALASVFQPVTTQAYPQPTQHHQTGQQPAGQTQQPTQHHQTGQQLAGQTQQPSAAQTRQQTQPPRQQAPAAPSQQQQQQQQQYFIRPGTSAASPGPTGYSYQRAAYSSFPRPAGPSQSGYASTSVPQYRYAGYPYTTGAAGGATVAANHPSFYPATCASAVPYAAVTAAAPSTARAGFAATSSASAGAVAPAATPADAQRLHEFYTRYYATPGRVSPGPGPPILRSSRSVPDLCQEVPPDADGGDVKRTKSHTPPPQAAAGGAQGWPSAAVDPLQGVSPEVRARLQELGQMGFPLDRLRRLHQQFNGDEKQVIEFALSAQRLEEAGHAPLEAEQGLLECDGDLGRAAEFLSSLAQLTGLGFPAPRAMDALKRADMHRDRALDLLIQG